MTKSTITRTWIAGLIVIVAGLIVGGLGVGLMLAYGGTYTPAVSGNGYDFVPRVDGFFWTTIALMVVGFGAALVGTVLQLVAWIGALIGTYALEDKTWFVVLLVGGLVGLAFGLVGFAVMVAYLIAGPDVAIAPRHPVAPPPAPPAPPAPYSSTLAPTS